MANDEIHGKFKELMYTDVEFLPMGSGILCRFYYQRQNEKKSHYIDNPTPKWLMDFISQNKPYEVVTSRTWSEAYFCAIAQEAKPLINKVLYEKEILTDDELCDIFSSVCAKYDSSVSNQIINSENFLKYISIQAEKVWKWKGE